MKAKKKNRIQISLNVSILSIFLTLFILTVAIIIFTLSIYFTDTFIDVSKQQMTQTTRSTNLELENLLNSTEKANHLSIDLIREKVLNPADISMMAKYTANLLNSLPKAVMAYWADEEGNFIVARQQGDKNNLEISAIRRNPLPAVSMIMKFDEQGNILSKQTTPLVQDEYDPRKRPWYLNALKRKIATWSDAYVFFTGGGKIIGATVSTPIYTQQKKLLGVFGIDVKLEDLTNFLQSQKIGIHGKAFIVNKKGQLIAYPGKLLAASDEKARLRQVEEILTPWIRESYAQFIEKGEAKFSFLSNSNRYLASYQLIPSFSEQQWYTAIVVPEDDFIGTLKESYLAIVSICILTLILGVMFVTVFSRKISLAIKKLSKRALETNSK